MRFWFYGITWAICCILSMPLLASAKFSVCPNVTDISYNAKQDGRFEAKSKDAMLWQSDVMASLQKLPPIEYQGIIALGQKQDAKVVCAYRFNANSFTLTTKNHFALAEGWQELRAGLYFCPKAKACGFSSK